MIQLMTAATSAANPAENIVARTTPNTFSVTTRIAWR
jgi:hypothetical protein